MTVNMVWTHNRMGETRWPRKVLEWVHRKSVNETSQDGA
jgi:hypothetical protein